MKKILIYSIHGTAKIDYRIISQAVFLKNSGYDVSILELFTDIHSNTKIYEDEGIEYHTLKLNFFERILFRNMQSFKNKFYREITRAIQKLFIDFNIKEKVKGKVAIFLDDLKPDIIISRDISSYLPEKFKIINDLHEVFYFQGKKILSKLKEIQDSDLSFTKGIICVTPQIGANFYNKFFEEGRGIVIPNAPYGKLLPKMLPNFKVNSKIRFLIHGSFIKSREAVTLRFIENFSKLNVNAILYLRFLDKNANVMDLEKQYAKQIADGKIVFLDPVRDGIFSEVESMTNNFDVGVITVDTSLSPQYNICSPNRLGTYLHSGMAILHNSSLFINQIVTESSSGIMFDEGKEEDIAAKIQYLCDNPEKLMKMKENSYNFAKKSFNYENYGKALIKMIESI
jgi:glycosyltransferase involved in cell wall biosynthesis